MPSLFIGRAGQAGVGVPAGIPIAAPGVVVKNVGETTIYLGHTDQVTVEGGGSYPLSADEVVTFPVTEDSTLWIIGAGSVAIIRQEPES